MIGRAVFYVWACHNPGEFDNIAIQTAYSGMLFNVMERVGLRTYPDGKTLMTYRIRSTGDGTILEAAHDELVERLTSGDPDTRTLEYLAIDFASGTYPGSPNLKRSLEIRRVVKLIHDLKAENAKLKSGGAGGGQARGQGSGNDPADPVRGQGDIRVSDGTLALAALVAYTVPVPVGNTAPTAGSKGSARDTEPDGK